MEPGSQNKYERARYARSQRRKGYHKPYSGTRFLTDKELQVWYARLDHAMGKKVKVPK